MCSKDLDKQYIPDIVFLLCSALFFISMSLLQMHYIFFTLCGVTDQNALKNFSLPDNSYCKFLQTVMCKSMLPTMFIKMCVKLKHIHLASYVEVETLTSKVMQPDGKQAS